MKDLKVKDRVRLLKMGDDPDPITPGTMGTIVGIYPQGSTWAQVDVKWDNGRNLMLVIPPDQVEKVVVAK